MGWRHTDYVFSSLSLQNPLLGSVDENHQILEPCPMEAWWRASTKLTPLDPSVASHTPPTGVFLWVPAGRDNTMKIWNAETFELRHNSTYTRHHSSPQPKPRPKSPQHYIWKPKTTTTTTTPTTHEIKNPIIFTWFLIYTPVHSSRCSTKFNATPNQTKPQVHTHPHASRAKKN